MFKFSRGLFEGFVVLIVCAGAAGLAFAQQDQETAAEDVVSPDQVEDTPAGPSSELYDDEASAAVGQLLEASLAGIEGRIAAGEGLEVPLPEQLAEVAGILRMFGLSPVLDSLSDSLNKAGSEVTVDVLGEVGDAIQSFAPADAGDLLADGPRSVSEAVRIDSGVSVRSALRPLVAERLTALGTDRLLERIAARGGSLVRLDEVDLTGHVTDAVVERVFGLLAQQEERILADADAVGEGLITLLARRAPESGEAAAPEGKTEGGATRGLDRSTEGDSMGPLDPELGGVDGLFVSRAHSGVREALRVSAKRAVERAAAVDGFLGYGLIRIELPEQMASAGDLLRRFGMGEVVQSFETSMNRAAERASREAAPILSDAIASVSIADVVAVIRGGNTAATDLLRDRTATSLTVRFQPIVASALDEVGATRAFDDLMARGGTWLSITGLGSFDLTDYVTGKALDGLFTLLGEEEARIREDPAARTSDLLRSVFAGFK